ncbi:hypothetical protein MBH78_03635 [Oceanimonas sp. NS1]|nr:hypothetical protein [Oceanimonas sp. NS1]
MNPRDFWLIVLVAAIWGINFSMIKLGVSELDPLLVAAARFLCATFPIIFSFADPRCPGAT